MNCKICSQKFNDLENKPNVLNCGHIYCYSCLQSKETCPKCNKQITSKLSIFLDYDEDATIDQKLSDDDDDDYENDSIRKYFTEIKVIREKFYALHKNKLNESKKKIESIKNEINKRTNELINVILTNQDRLFKEIEKLNQNILKQLSDLTHNEQHIQTRLTQLKIKLVNLTQTESNAYRENIKKLKSDLDLEYDNLSNFENKCQFKCNVDLHLNVKDNVIGKIVLADT